MSELRAAAQRFLDYLEYSRMDYNRKYPGNSDDDGTLADALRRALSAQGEPSRMKRALQVIAIALAEPSGGEYHSARKLASEWGIYNDDLEGNRVLLRLAEAALASPEPPPAASPGSVPNVAPTYIASKIRTARWHITSPEGSLGEAIQELDYALKLLQSTSAAERPQRDAREAERLWRWLTDRVWEGRGAIELGMTEEGTFGLFRNDGGDAWGHGGNVKEAVEVAMEKYPVGKDYHREPPSAGKE